MILFKLMEQAIARHPNWGMQNRCLLGSVNVEAGTVRIDDAAQERVLQEAILKILNGEAVQKYYWAEYKIINSANVDDLDSQN